MLAPCGDQAGDGSAEVTLPGDGAILGEDSVPDAAEGEPDQESDEESAPAAHEYSGQEEVSHKAIDDGTRANVDTIGSTDEPGPESA